ncbi:AEC family transporter [Micromonospora echinofusca]|uniref:AEC family transporter n=1 Tax=Micromonospora echinofusca TaxID=47858 RepID=A0ABS3W0P9_MICEH|nr:AEC family transporter [Micromonospora echinofusca]MBO4210359.1 AEC family transporter [Micromonospora echinofusca]
MRGVFASFTTIWALTVVGYLIGRYGLLGPHGTAVTARLVFFVAAPALLFTTLARAGLEQIFTPALAVFVVSTVLVAVCYLLLAGREVRADPARATVGVLGASYVNAANLGLPVAAYVLGDVSLVAPVLLFQVLVATPLALAVLDRAAGRSGSVGRLVALPVRNPIMLGCAAGLVVAVSGWQPPVEMFRPFELVGSAAVPLALLALGMSLPGSRPLARGADLRERWLAVGLKVLGQPLVAYAVGRWGFGLTGPALLAAVVTTALPTAQNIFVYATRYDRATGLARDTIVLSTVAAAVSLVVITLLLG